MLNLQRRIAGPSILALGPLILLLAPAPARKSVV